jgi:Raf kinase inhibitor-like YbhB/YbcL family protein
MFRQAGAMRSRRVAATVSLLFMAGACGTGGGSDLPDVSASDSISLTSPAIRSGGTFPVDFTCDGRDVSPPLAWSGGPPSEEYALVLSDFDAPGGSFTHWVVYGIPGNATSMAEGVVPDGSRSGENDFGRTGYGGPCPPGGDAPHRYLFVLYGLRTAVGGSIPDGAGLSEVLDAIRCCIQAQGTLQASYARQG